MADDLLARFRQVALERIEQIEEAWNRLVQGGAPADVGVKLRRELHTFKGEASVIGFADVGLVCHKLEELVQSADRLSYRVPQDLDLLVMMAIRFMLLLVRKRAGHKLGGIDLAGFVKQVDEVVAEARAAPTTPGRAALAVGAPSPSAGEPGDRLSAPTRQRLGRAAVLAFLEYTRASGDARERLREVWQILAGEIGALGTVELVPRLRRHARHAIDLARDLGKEVEVDVAVSEEVRVAPEVGASLDIALLHILRNAVDHGIETREVRRAGGKANPAHLSIRAEPRPGDELLELVIEDDGGGVDLDAVAARAAELGLRDPAGPTASPAELLELLFHPGFTTRRSAGAVSGRGIGLDAVRASLQEKGGAVTVRSIAGRGTAFTLRAPRAVGRLEVSCFRAAGEVDLLLALPAAWEVSVGEDPTGAADPLAALELGSPRSPGTGDGALRLRRGRLEHRWRTAGPVHQATAIRIGALGDEQLAEVVDIDGREALLLRPDVLLS